MIGITVKDLVKDQDKRLKRMRQTEDEEKVPETAKCLFRQKPYYMLANRRDDDECR